MSQELLICPFNTAHSILAYRFQKHLVQCRKQYPNVILEQCPYNINHLVKPELFQEHKETCKDRINFIQVAEKLAAIQVDPVPSLTSNTNNNEEDTWEIETEETWDSSVDKLKPNARDVVRGKPVLRNNIGMTKAQKKKFREQENERIRNLTEPSKNK